MVAFGFAQATAATFRQRLHRWLSVAETTEVRSRNHLYRNFKYNPKKSKYDNQTICIGIPAIGCTNPG